MGRRRWKLRGGRGSWRETVGIMGIRQMGIGLGIPLRDLTIYRKSPYGGTLNLIRLHLLSPEHGITVQPILSRLLHHHPRTSQLNLSRNPLRLQTVANLPVWATLIFVDALRAQRANIGLGTHPLPMTYVHLNRLSTSGLRNLKVGSGGSVCQLAMHFPSTPRNRIRL